MQTKIGLYVRKIIRANLKSVRRENHLIAVSTHAAHSDVNGRKSFYGLFLPHGNSKYQ